MSTSEIGRFMFSSPWDDTFTQIIQSLLPTVGLDYNPIIVEFGDLNLKQSYFKFEQWWFRVEGFLGWKVS